MASGVYRFWTNSAPAGAISLARNRWGINSGKIGQLRTGWGFVAAYHHPTVGQVDVLPPLYAAFMAAHAGIPGQG